MKVIKLLGRISAGHLWEVVLLALKNPRFLFPTAKATKECMRLATHFYGRAHYRNGAANAFRHALWNYLIAHHCHKWRKNETKVLVWTTDITDWHEKAFINRDLARAMDLHNNSLGREAFKQHRTKDKAEVIALLRKWTAEARNIERTADIIQYPNNLVYLQADTPNKKTIF